MINSIVPQTEMLQVWHTMNEADVFQQITSEVEIRQSQGALRQMQVGQLIEAQVQTGQVHRLFQPLSCG